ncbi:hypothetical protein JJB09_00905 [Rhizobium sp. KVB221]|uniref:Uncharacterized protein n=1 Tax=Rhizobium setariae TaxID=2801340 RepID=A0A936YHZ2_9HYPH|nr:hypothetical protein [Rhizobium setariae]MBL0370574.1 hypothetical protein [Rhizobium setariae]
MNLNEILRSLVSETIKTGNHYDVNAIIAKAKADHSKLIEMSASSLIDRALKRMISDIGNKPPKVRNPNQTDMFDETPSLPLSFRLKDAHGQTRTLSPLDIPMDQLSAEIDRKIQNNAKNINSTRKQEVEKFRTENKSHIISPSDTMNDVIKRRSKENS